MASNRNQNTIILPQRYTHTDITRGTARCVITRKVAMVNVQPESARYRKVWIRPA